MIKFFRKIRQRLLVDLPDGKTGNRFSKYLLYALGEIVLVVIGILIALQINNWNQTENNRMREVDLLKNLNLEFKKNKANLQATINDHRGMLNAVDEIMELMGKPESALVNVNVDSLLYLSIDYDDFNPSQSVIDEAISSGTVSLIRTESLRTLIFDWVSAEQGLQESYATMDEMSQSITLPYLAKNASMKNIDYYGLLKENGKSKFPSKNPALFTDVEFENMMDNQAWGLTNYIMKLENLEGLIDEIIHQTDVHIQKSK